MRHTPDDLMDEYLRADFTKRLHLYLQYPELRAEFAEMERQGFCREAGGRGQEPECPRFSWGALFTLNGGCVRRLFGVSQGRP